MASRNRGTPPHAGNERGRDPSIRTALISVFDKTGIVEFSRALHEEFGIEIISTGGTAGALRAAGVPVTLVEVLTGSEEMLDGRVKTLHARIHAAILADRDNPEHMRQLTDAGIQPIDLVVINLYPFERTAATSSATFEQAIEMIDIGGPCLLRAAAKNHRHVLVVDSPRRYPQVLDFLRSDRSSDDRTRIYRSAALDAFHKTSAYDATIATWLELQAGGAGPGFHTIRLRRLRSLRYGENPHQQAELLASDSDALGALDLANADVIGGGADRLSFNNYVDASAAVELCADLARQSRSRPGESQNVAVLVKHANPCGVGVAEDAIEALRKAYLGDPGAAMGGILACSFAVDEHVSDAVMNALSNWGRQAGASGFFVEVWAAPKFADAAVHSIRGRRNWGERVRLLRLGDISRPPDPLQRQIRSIPGGMLMQTPDLTGAGDESWRVVTRRGPTGKELSSLRLAWLICKHSRSNAISICTEGMLIGNGAGQMSRVMSCRLAVMLAEQNGHGAELTGSVAASDAFFPFRDGPDILAHAGVTAIVQPGGSKRDDETIAACDERGMAMIHAGLRHFRH